MAAALEPIVAAIAATVHEMLSEIPAGLAEDVVRGKVRLAGGGALLPGLASRIETAAGIGTVLVEDPMRCVIRGAAEILERKDQGHQSGPGLRQLTLVTERAGCVPLLQRLPGDDGRLAPGQQPADDRRDHRHADDDEQQLPVGTLDSSDRPSSGLSQA